jgi:hypothetical protein
MELTQERIDEMMKHAAEVGKGNRERLGYSNDNFVPVAVIVGPHCEEAVMSIRHRNNDEKRIKMAALSAAAKDAGAIAILMVNDARWAHADKFGEYFHLPPIEEIGVEKWGREYLSILNGVYGGSLGNCPREVWEEALCVSIKGPAVEPQMLFLRYEKGPGDTVKWLDGADTIADKDAVAVKINILPDWWDEPTGRPA